MHAPSPPPPSAPAAATLPLSPSSSSSFNSSAPHSPLPHRPTVRVLSSQEDLASRPPSALSARSSPTPGPERALSSRPAAQGPQTSTLNGRAVSPGTLFLASTRRVGSNGAEQSGGGLSTADAAGRIARESGSRDELERPSSTTSPTPQAQDVTPSAARPSGRTTPTPNALSPRLRPHGPIITRVSSPMDPSFAARTTPDTGSHDGSSSAAFPPSPTVAARPLSPPSTVARRSSSDLLAAYASPEGSHLAPLSPGDVVADSAAGATFVRERHATAGRASEDSFASGSMQDTQPPRPTVPASRPAQQAQSHNAEPPFSSLHVAPPRPSTSPSPPASTAAPAVVPSRLHHVHPTSSTSPRAPRPQRKHVLHPGRNRFLLSGRLLTSGDNPLPLVGSLGVAFALPALWWAFNGRFLWGEWSGAGKAGVFVFAYLVLVMWSSMLRTAFSDPGILPRDLDPVPPRKWVPRSRAGEDSTASDGEWLVEAKWIRVRDGGVVASKWCETCHTYRPPRTSHCRLCDNCVERTDHHCAFLNNCIGQRNYLPFCAFLVSAVLCGMYALAFSAYHISQRAASASELRQWDTIGAIVVLVATVAFLVPVAGLAGYHAKLVLTNRTTIEMLRPASARAALSPLTSEPIAANPWTRRTGLRNVLAVLCAPGALAGRESWVDARGWAGEDRRGELARRGKGRGMGQGTEEV